MRYRRVASAVALFLLIVHPEDGGSANTSRHRFSQPQFRVLMETLARGWNSNNATLAANCFTNDAIYSAPPDGPVRHGKRELFEFFGGEKGRDQPMSMEWHHLIFDEATQMGAGEYTFSYKIRTHGVAIVRLVDGKIANWREYEQASPLPWSQFIGENHF
ncbi:MAG TPA: nuclear transport factor 2 family protein [Terriglobales bacterium]|nr:nuclear transport factor 2 family protein [Terriglobales bacterium]